MGNNAGCIPDSGLLAAVHNYAVFIPFNDLLAVGSLRGHLEDHEWRLQFETRLTIYWLTIQLLVALEKAPQLNC